MTHDQEEALEVADRIVVMNRGHVEQIGTPQEVYNNPATPYVYNFLGHVNQFKSHVLQGQAKIGDITIQLEAENQQADGAALAYIRPHDIDVQKSKNGTTPAFEAKINYIHAIGPLVRLELQQLGQEDIIEAELTQERFRELGLSAGEQVFIYPRNVRVFLDSPSQA